MNKPRLITEPQTLVDEAPKRPSHRALLLPLFVVTVCLFVLTAYCTTRWKATWTNPFRHVELTGDWIQAPESESCSGYFRKRFDLTSPIRHAWLMVAGKDGFEATINRNPVGRQYLWRPTRPFQTGGSEKGQRVIGHDSAMALNFPREYQWAGHQNWLLPTYMDITNEFQIGPNVICLEIESRSAPASVNFFGEITLCNGTVIPIRSDKTWQSEPVPLGPQLVDWTELGYWDKSWRKSQLSEGPTNSVLRTVPVEIFARPFSGNWMQAPTTGTPSQRFRAQWHVDGDIDEAWLRIIANRRYDLFINDHRVSVNHTRPPDLDNGQWIVGRDSALDPVSKPELLDPDEVGEFFGGQKFENPRDAQPNLEEFIRLKPKTHLPFRNYKTTNRAEDGGEFDPTRTLAESRRTPAKPDLPAERPIPNSLKRDRAVGGYLAYSIRNLLRPGWNDIEIRCLDESDFNWQTRIAVDGLVHLENGQQVAIPTAKNWYVVEDSNQTKTAVQVVGPVQQPGQKLPRMQYRGVANEPSSIGQRFTRELGTVTLVGLFSLALIGLIFFSYPQLGSFANNQISDSPRTHADSESRRWPALVKTLFAMMLTACVTLLCGVLLEMSLQERHEILWFQRGIGWQFLFAVTAVLSLGIGVADAIGRCRLDELRERGHRLSTAIRSLPDTRLWPHLICWVLLLTALLRGYQLDTQPLDDDEYASTQAITAILETGAPGFVPENIYYTRSPLYHYVTAAVAYPFGGTLWSLRLQSVLWSMATVLLAYFCGSRLLNSRWLGFAAMVLLAIHPFEVFTGHVIRFYQMQQFFALLTVYLFCRGFVTDQKQSFRIATIIVFLCAVLSQEISAVLGVPLLLGYILFGEILAGQKTFN